MKESREFADATRTSASNLAVNASGRPGNPVLNPRLSNAGMRIECRISIHNSSGGQSQEISEELNPREEGSK